MLADLVAAVGGSPDSDVRMISLEPPGPYSRTTLPARHARDSQTLIALKLNGEILDLDHGYPCRLIAPTRPGVLQTKWLTRIEVVTVTVDAGVCWSPLRAVAVGGCTARC